MILPLYSDGHLQTAKKLIPDQVSDPSWLNQRWTDDEINLCKEYELGRDLANNPTLKYWEKRVLGGRKIKDYNDEILEWYLEVLPPKSPSVLSVGSGQGYREIALALHGNCGQIIALDLVPYQDTLNKLLPDEVSRILCFKKGNAYNIPFGDNTFDVVMSHAVVYCIPDDKLQYYFAELLRVVKPQGICLVSTVANIPLKEKFILWLNAETKPKGWKQTGWRRDKKHIMRYMPDFAKITRTKNMRHDMLPSILRKSEKPNILGKLLIWFSKNLYPVINAIVAFQIKKTVEEGAEVK